LNRGKIAIVAMIMVGALVLGTVAVSYQYAFAVRPPRVAHDPCAKIVVSDHNPNCDGPRRRR
jgi:hypothetical protein